MHLFRTNSFKATLLAVLTGAGLAHSTSAAESAGAPVALDRAPQSAAMADSVVTVDSLVKLENRLALTRSEEAAVAAGLSAPPAAKQSKSSGPVAPRMTVLSIYGVGDNLRANFTLDTDLYENVRAGAKAGSCVVRSIDERTVALASAGKKGGASVLCPTGRWTGLPTMQRFTEAADMRARVAMPSPSVPVPFSSAGQPSVALQQRASQPVVLTAPAPAISLIPRQTDAAIDERLDKPVETN